LQYWGERYGPQSASTLEDRVAAFLKALITAPGLRTVSMGHALRYDWATGSQPELSDGQARNAALDAFRELMVATYVHAAGNASDYPEYLFRDERVRFGGSGTGTHPTRYGDLPELQPNDLESPMTWDAQRILPARALVYRADLPSDAVAAQVTLTRTRPYLTPLYGDFGALRVAVIREQGGTDTARQIDVQDQFMARTSEMAGESTSIPVPVEGWDRLGIIVVGPPGGLAVPFDLRVDITDSTGTQSPSQTAPASSSSPVGVNPVDGVDGVIELGAERSAGAPLQIAATLSDGAGPLTDATVDMFITDPTGVVHSVELDDEGLATAGVRGDGRYAGVVWGTDAAGTYTISVHATGTDNGGQPFDATLPDSVTLTAKIDADGDGLSDLLEQRLGLDPADPGDGGSDLEGDGVATRDEISAGSSPLHWDSDGGGEGDASEIAAGLDPTDPVDDRAVPDLLLTARALDGNRTEIRARTIAGTGSVELYRVPDGGSAELVASVSGAGAVVSDGPLTDGSYRYFGLAVDASGARSIPVWTSSIDARLDASPPTVRLSVNEGQWDASSRLASVRFVDLSEPVSEFRLAESTDALAVASWQPFTAVSDFEIGAELGEHVLYGQVRDGAGNESSIATGVLFLSDTTPPTSAAGSLDATVTAPTIDVPYTASDDLSGIDSVELWSRYRLDAQSGWDAWTRGPSGSSSPISFSFGSGPGMYEFYTVAVDGAGNREAAPPSADTWTQHGIPPDFTVSLSAQRPWCQAFECEQEPLTNRTTLRCRPPSCGSQDKNTVLTGSGTATAGTPVSVEWRLYGVDESQQRTLLQDWRAAVASDGAFDEASDAFTISDSRYTGGLYDAYDVEIRAVAGGQTTARTTRVAIEVIGAPDP
jgi:hypothetical protein